MKMRILKKTLMRVAMKIRIIIHSSLILSFFFSFYFWNSYISTFLQHCIFIQAYQHKNLVIKYAKFSFFFSCGEQLFTKNNWIEFIQHLSFFIFNLSSAELKEQDGGPLKCSSNQPPLIQQLMKSKKAQFSVKNNC